MDGSIPTVLDLTASNINRVSHAYGTTGIITEVEMPLAPAVDWVDVIVSFPTLEAAVRHGETLAAADGLLLKNVAVMDAAVTPYLKRHKPYLADGEAFVVLIAAAFAVGDAAALAARAGGRAGPALGPARRTRSGIACRQRSSCPGTTPPCARCGSTRRSPTCRCSTRSRTLRAKS